MGSQVFPDKQTGNFAGQVDLQRKEVEGTDMTRAPGLAAREAWSIDTWACLK